MRCASGALQDPAGDARRRGEEKPTTPDYFKRLRREQAQLYPRGRGRRPTPRLRQALGYGRASEEARSISAARATRRVRKARRAVLEAQVAPTSIPAPRRICARSRREAHQEKAARRGRERKRLRKDAGPWHARLDAANRCLQHRGRRPLLLCGRPPRRTRGPRQRRADEQVRARAPQSETPSACRDLREPARRCGEDMEKRAETKDPSIRARAPAGGQVVRAYGKVWARTATR